MEIKDEKKLSSILTDLGIAIQSAWNLVEDGKEVLASRKLQGAMTKYNELIVFVSGGLEQEKPQKEELKIDELAANDSKEEYHEQ